MPEISRFLGVIIRMHYRDNTPPHFHAHYGDYEITVEVESGLVTGKFPKRAMSAVLEWHGLHREALIQNWQKAVNRETLQAIPPLNSMDFIRIRSARHLSGHQLALVFDDGSEGVDLSAELEGPVFAPLRDIDYFKQFQLVGSTLEWPNGADFAPEFLHQLAHASEAALA